MCVCVHVCMCACARPASVCASTHECAHMCMSTHECAQVCSHVVSDGVWQKDYTLLSCLEAPSRLNGTLHDCSTRTTWWLTVTPWKSNLSTNMPCPYSSLHRALNKHALSLLTTEQAFLNKHALSLLTIEQAFLNKHALSLLTTEQAFLLYQHPGIVE